MVTDPKHVTLGVRSGIKDTKQFTIFSSFEAYERLIGTHDHILLSQIRDSPNLDGQVPVFISPRTRVTQLYPQALGSLSVASYDSQGYGGGIRTRLHTGLK
jgi:hypothetical protein